MTPQEKIPEAVASATYSVTTKNGFPVLFTVRSESGTALLIAMDKVETTLLEKGYKPQERKSFGFGTKQEKVIKYVDGRTCPLCHERLIEATTKAGKQMIKCSTQKWDYQTKTPSGCPFVEWGKEQA